MVVDVDGQELKIGDRIVSLDRTQGVRIAVGTITGFTAKRANVLFKGEPKSTGKQFDTIAKIFDQKEE